MEKLIPLAQTAGLRTGTSPATPAMFAKGTIADGDYSKFKRPDNGVLDNRIGVHR